MTEKYRPSNGAEGESFFSAWCEKCDNDSKEPLCEILTRSMAFDIEDQEYPVEWVCTDKGPECTAFVEKGSRITSRCEKTPDMFGGDARHE